MHICDVELFNFVSFLIVDQIYIVSLTFVQLPIKYKRASFNLSSAAFMNGKIA